MSKTIYLVRDISSEPDRRDMMDGYEDMPNRAFTTLEKACAAVKRWTKEELDEMNEDNDEPDMFADALKALESLDKDAKEFFDRREAELAAGKKPYEIEQTFRFTSDGSMTTTLISVALMDEED